MALPRVEQVRVLLALTLRDDECLNNQQRAKEQWWLTLNLAQICRKASSSWPSSAKVRDLAATIMSGDHHSGDHS
ncbi:hypothetical protein NL676_022727 [Syzygium grande]|nr:hypothetical protein NL676_022727 [Syzygium grande]